MRHLPISLAFFLLSAVQATAVTFDDGQVHIIDSANSFPLEDVIVRDGPGPSTTTVNFVEGGQVGGTVQAFDTSVVNITGGDYGLIAFLPGDLAVVTMSGGVVRLIRATGGSQVDVLAGQISDGLDAIGFSNVTLSGGLIGGITASANGVLHFEGGEVTGRLKADRDGTIIMSAGSVAGNADVTEQATLTIAGGSIAGDVMSRGDAQLQIFGGTFGPNLFALDTGNVTIFGTGFNRPLGEVTDLSGSITGVLTDGTPIGIEFGRASTASIVLAATSDPDGDGVPDGLDNCPDVPNADQTDTDGNGLGDACNDAEDFDGDEFADDLDNCPDDPNADQSDLDEDGVGDACDPFPEDPNNRAAQCEEDLAACEAVPAFVDTDGDGEEDSTDACPGTLAFVVDQAGCSLAQFCAAIDVSTNTGARMCRNGDWGNDEPITNPKDCVVVKQVQPPVCVPAQ